MSSKLDWLQAVGNDDCLELYRIAARMCRTGGWALDLISGKILCTQEAAKILGGRQLLSARETVRRCVPEHQRVVRNAFLSCIRSGRPFFQTIRIVRIPGDKVWVRLTGEAVRDLDGKVIRVQGAIQDVSEQKAIEANLEKSELHFRDFANTIPFILWTAAPTGEVDYSNRAFMDYTGVPESQDPASRWQPVVHPDDLSDCLPVWTHCVATGEPYRVEMRLRRGSDQQYRWFRVHALPVHDRNGLIRKWYGIGLDIHDMKILRAKFEALAAEQESFLESISDAFFSISADGNFRYLNRQAEQILGMPAEKLKGRELWQSLPEMRNTELGSAFLKTQTDRVTCEVEVFFPGLERWFLVRSYPARDGISVFLLDVTQRKINHERLTLFTRVASDVLYDWNLITGQVWRGEKFFDIYCSGKTFDMGRIDDWAELIHPNDRQTVLASLKTAINGDANEWQAEYRIIRKDDREVYVLDRATIVRNAAGEPIRVVGGMSDDTKRIQAERAIKKLNIDLERRVTERTAKLEFINRELESFSYMVSHDLRAPLRALKGFAEILAREYSTSMDAEGNRIARVIQDEAEKMGQMISDLLEFSRMGRSSLVNNSCDMSQLAQQAFEEIPNRERRHVTDFRLPSLPRVSGDAAMLKLVWQNIISNAVKFTRHARPAIIAVECESSESEFQFSVADNGIGFDPKFSKKIFDVFRRLHHSKEYEGTGIGLAIVQRIIQRHGGRVWAESYPGGGVKLTFTVPAPELATGSRAARIGDPDEVRDGPEPPAVDRSQD